jgi:hypothetical protein
VLGQHSVGRDHDDAGQLADLRHLTLQRNEMKMIYFSH